MKKSGFTLIEISVSALIVSIIATVLIVVLRGNLNTLKFGQKHMDFDRKILLTIRRMFYDLKHINPILSKSEKYGYTLKGENIGEPKPRKVFIRKSKDLKEKQDELEFVIDSNLDVDDIYNIKYYVTKDHRLMRETRDKSAKTTADMVIENVDSFLVTKDEKDIKQIYIKFMVSDAKKALKRDIDFAVRLESDFVYVDEQEL